MARVRVVHWFPDTVGPLLAMLREGGFETEYEAKTDSSALRKMREAPPDAVVIDVARRPSHGREVAVAIRGSKAIRHVPIVFVDGEADKVEALRALLPDAVFTTSDRLVSVLRDCQSSPPANPVVPTPMMDRYASRTVAQKLGIVAGRTVGLLDAPRDYARVLGDLPEGVEILEDPATPCAVTVWFVRDSDAYRRRLPELAPWAGPTKFWVIWPKQAGKLRSDLRDSSVRNDALALGLVDYKVCSLDATWTGMLFARKSP